MQDLGIIKTLKVVDYIAAEETRVKNNGLIFPYTLRTIEIYYNPAGIYGMMKKKFFGAADYLRLLFEESRCIYKVNIIYYESLDVDKIEIIPIYMVNRLV